MLLQDKKGLSIMIGYVLLVAIAIILSLVVYQFIKTYIPREALECPDGVSVFITEAKYVCGVNTLEVTIKNNGLFNVAGYFIRATTEVGQELATLDLSGKVESGGDDENYMNAVIFVPGKNFLIPNEATKTTFDLSELVSLENHKIEIIPVRWQEEEGKMRFASCSNAKVGEVLSCWEEPEVCEPDCSGRECGPDSCGDYCPDYYNNCGDKTVGYVCDGTGTCVPPEECTDTCATYGYVCGTWTICGALETCLPGCTPVIEECSTDGTSCELLCGNGEIDTGEECDDGGTDSGDGCSSTCQIETDWVCIGEPSVCSYCNSNLICETILGEDCLCPDCEGKKDGCSEGYVCEDGSCVEMPAVDSCKSYCSYLGYNSIASFCASNCGGGCDGICEPYDVSEYCQPENPSAPHYCCCVPYA